MSSLAISFLYSDQGFCSYRGLRHVKHQILGTQGMMAPQKLYKGKLDVIPSIFTKVNGVKRISFSHLAWDIY